MTTTDLEPLKKRIKQFPFYTEDAFDIAAPYFKQLIIKKGDYYLTEGKVSKSIAFIVSGLFRTYYLKDGLEVTTCFCKENSFTTSYKSLITKQPSDLSIQAIEDAELLVIQFEDLKKLYEKHLFWQQVGRLVAEQEFVFKLE